MIKILIAISGSIVIAYLSLILLEVWGATNFDEETWFQITISVIIAVIILSIAIALINASKDQEKQKSDTGKDLIS